LLYCWGSGSSHLWGEGTTITQDYFLKMRGNEVFRHAVRIMGSACEKVLEIAGISQDKIDLFIAHQANIRIIKAMASRLNLPSEKVYINIERFGNTSAASVPIALNEALETGVLKPGQLCLMCSFGGGLTWGSAVVRI
jgi:3-oxoacyl-[acyl-carrier-protein] synthase-3